MGWYGEDALFIRSLAPSTSGETEAQDTMTHLRPQAGTLSPRSHLEPKSVAALSCWAPTGRSSPAMAVAQP